MQGTLTFLIEINIIFSSETKLKISAGLGRYWSEPVQIFYTWSQETVIQGPWST